MTTYTIRLRRGTAAEWTADNPVLAVSEPGHEIDTDKLKIGDGSTPWNSLPYVTGGDGDGASGTPGPRGEPVDLSTLQKLEDFVVQLSNSANMMPFGNMEVADPANAELADGFNIYGTPSYERTALGFGWGQRLYAPSGNHALIADAIPCPTTGVPYVLSCKIDIASVVGGGNVTLVMEMLDFSAGTIDYVYQQKFVATAGPDPEIFETYMTAPSGTVAIRGKLEINGGADVMVSEMAIETGIHRSDFVSSGSWIAVHNDQQVVRPYGANLACCGLLEAYKYTRNEDALKAAIAWLRWYRGHMDASTGYVTDYDLVDGVLVSTDDMDSTDSYAATYLLALKFLWNATHDLPLLQEFEDSIELAVHAISTTLNDSGPAVNLTYAKPTWDVAYMQDNAEVYVGLHAAAYLQGLLGNDTLQQDVLDMADLIEIGIEGMWDVTDESYDWAIHDNGTRQPTDWSNINDANQNIWPVSFGIVSGARAQALVQEYLTEHPDWYIADPNYYAIPSWGLQRQNYPAASDEALHSILDQTYTDVDGPLSYPFDSLMAGTFILAYTGGAIEQIGPPAIVGFQGGVAGPEGPRGFPGPAGSDGDPGPSGADGTFSSQYKGAYVAGEYDEGDIVTYGGETWVANQDVHTTLVRDMRVGTPAPDGMQGTWAYDSTGARRLTGVVDSDFASTISRLVYDAGATFTDITVQGKFSTKASAIRNGVIVHGTALEGAAETGIYVFVQSGYFRIAKFAAGAFSSWVQSDLTGAGGAEADPGAAIHTLRVRTQQSGVNTLIDVWWDGVHKGTQQTTATGVYTGTQVAWWTEDTVPRLETLSLPLAGFPDDFFDKLAAKGADGAPGAAGAPGAPGAPGSAAIWPWKGVYSQYASYAEGDVVTFRGSAYRARTAVPSTGTPGVPTLRGTATGQGTTTVPIVTPAGTVAGDRILVGLHYDVSSGQHPIDNPADATTVPAGWNLVGVQPGSVTNHSLFLFEKVCTAAEVAGSTVNFPGFRSAATMRVYSPCIIQQVKQSYGPGSSNNGLTTALTASAPNSLHVAFMSGFYGFAIYPSVASYGGMSNGSTTAWGANYGHGIGSAQETSAAGAVTAKTWNWTTISDWASVDVILLGGTAPTSIPGSFDLIAQGTGAVQYYTPTVTAEGGGFAYGTSPTRFGRYVDDGVWVTGDVFIKLGTSPTAGTDFYSISLPVPAHVEDGDPMYLKAGDIDVYDASTDTHYLGTVSIRDSLRMVAYMHQAAAVMFGQLSPVTPAAGDFYRIQFRYRKA